jgi:Rhodopirellula transposase DDE domain
VKIGAYARGGLTRGDHQAREHERGWQETDSPWGIVDEDNAARTIPFGRASHTSDVIVEALTATGEAMPEHEKADTRLRQLNMDKGPESRGRRTPLLSRLGQLADAMHQPMQGLSYPPYPRKYHPIERCWGIVELQWHGTQLTDAATMLAWAKNMTGKGLRPVVARSRKASAKGLSLGKAAMQAVEARWKRALTLPKYDLVINPASTA